MSEIDEDLLMKLAEKLNTVSPESMATAVEEIIHDKPFIDSDGNVKEPFRTFLLLRIMGYAPAYLLLALHHIGQHPQISLPELVKLLGSKVKEGYPRVKIKALLTSLQKLRVLKAEGPEPKGKPTMRYSIDKLELHLFDQSIHDIMSGKRFDWSRLDIGKIIDKELNLKFKVKDLDGTIIPFRPLNMFESIIRYGAPTSVAWQAVLAAQNRIVKGECTNLQAINEVIVEELKKLYPQSVAAFLKDNPLGLTLRGGDHDGENLTYDIMEESLERFLSQHKMVSLPSKLHEQIVLVSLSQARREAKTKSEVEASRIPEILKFAIFQVYGKLIDEIISRPSEHLEKSRLFLHDAKEKLASDEPNLATKPLLCSLSRCLTPLCLSAGLLPEKDDSSTALLVRNLLSNAKEVQIKPQQTEKTTAEQIRKILAKQDIDSSELVRYIDSIVSVIDEEKSAIEIREPSLLKRDLERAISFVDTIIPLVEKALGDEKK